MAAVRAMGDVIIKPIFGSMGHGMVRVSDPDVAFRVVRPLEQTRARLLRAARHRPRRPRRPRVRRRRPGARRDRAPRAPRRVAHQRVARRVGAAVRAAAIAWAQLAVRAAAAVGADYAGVDLLPSRDGACLVLEVNGIPGWQGCSRRPGVDVAGAIVDHARVAQREVGRSPR